MPPRPLTGLLVVDLSQNLAGPYATQILADFGADVIKVEPPGGDPARAWGPPFQDGESPLYLSGNRNKRSVVLDLKGDERDREALRRLATRADVFVQAFRAGVIEKLGFGYDRVRELNRDVIYVSVTAFGPDGPLRDQPGYDPLMQAYGGLMSVTGHPGSPPTRVGTSLVDMGTGLWTAVAVLAEVSSRRSAPGEEAGDGAATHITTSLLDTAVGWMAYHLQGFAGSDLVPGPGGSGLGMIAPYEAFPAADGEVMIAAGNDAIFGRLCAALELPELARDPRFVTNADRVAHREDLAAALASRTEREPVAEVVQRLRAASVPCAPIQDAAQVVSDRQVAASGMLRPLEGGGPGSLDVAMPVRWPDGRPEARRPPPAVGAHTAEVLRELGLDGDGDGAGHGSASRG